MYVCFHRLSNNGGNKRLPRKRYQNLRVNKFASPVLTAKRFIIVKLLCGITTVVSLIKNQPLRVA